MKRSPLTEGIIFSIDILLGAGFDAAAKTLTESGGITLDKPEDAAAVAAMKREGSICAATVKFLKRRNK